MDSRTVIASCRVLKRLRERRGQKEDLLKEYNLTEEEFNRTLKQLSRRRI